jgi:hypothetical protein
MIVISVLYVSLCSLVAYLGRQRKFGFWGYLLASLLVSPVIGLLLVLASDKREAAPAAAAAGTATPAA